MIDDVDDSNVNQFYINVYTLSPNPDSFYDCRFDFVATSGNVGSVCADVTSRRTSFSSMFRGIPSLRPQAGVNDHAYQVPRKQRR